MQFGEISIDTELVGEKLTTKVACFDKIAP